MSNGVGIIAALSRSLPAIAGPRPTDPVAGPSRTPAPAMRPPTPRKAAPPVSPAAPRRKSEDTALRGSRESSPLLTTGTARVEGSGVAAKTENVRDLVRQVAVGFQTAHAQTLSRVRLTLRPAHLGELWIELAVAGSRIRGTIRTETEAARALILGRLDELKNALDRLGIRLSGLRVDVGHRPPADEESRPNGRGQESPVDADAERPRSHRRQRIDVRA